MNPTETIFCSTATFMVAGGIFLLALITNKLTAIQARLTQANEILENIRNLMREGSAGLDAACKKGERAFGDISAELGRHRPSGADVPTLLAEIRDTIANGQRPL